MQAARELEMQVHPILGLGAVGVVDTHLYIPSAETVDVPEWAGKWPCASWGENHEITVRAAQEIIEAYAPAGIHLDYVRYPNMSFLKDNPCHCERCCQRRLGWLGKEVPDERDLRIPGIIYKEIQMRAEFVRGTGVQWLAGVGRKSSLGELSPEEMARQICFAQAAGADGVCIFHAGVLGEEDLRLLPEVTAKD